MDAARPAPLVGKMLRRADGRGFTWRDVPHHGNGSGIDRLSHTAPPPARAPRERSGLLFFHRIADARLAGTPFPEPYLGIELLTLPIAAAPVSSAAGSARNAVVDPMSAPRPPGCPVPVRLAAGRLLGGRGPGGGRRTRAPSASRSEAGPRIPPGTGTRPAGRPRGRTSTTTALASEPAVASLPSVFVTLRRHAGDPAPANAARSAPDYRTVSASASLTTTPRSFAAGSRWIPCRNARAEAAPDRLGMGKGRTTPRPTLFGNGTVTSRLV